jgi:hypothetical protein
MPGPLRVVVLFAMLAVASAADGQVYRCEDAGGGTSYSDTPCAAKGSKSLRLQDDAPAAASPAVCEQMRDELDRLAAQAAHNAELHRPKNAVAVKRRQALQNQYKRRCVGITRTPR